MLRLAILGNNNNAMKTRCKRLLCLLLSLLLLCPAALAEDDELEMSNEELTQLLWEMYQTENGDTDYTVLPDDYEPPIEGKSGIYNLLLLGIDNPGDALTGRSDTMLLASFNARTGTLKLISFMRDTYVSIPRHGRNKLNAAYSFGGAALLLETLETAFGVQVDGYVAVNYQLMADLVDAIGGVELDVTADEMKKLNGILEYYNRQRGADKSEQLLQQYGTLRLTGLQTMSYARIRKLDSDFVRVERQQRVITAIYQQICTLDLMQLTTIMTTYIGKVGTNVTLAQAAQLLTSLMGNGDVQIQSLRVPADGAYRSGIISDTYYIIPKLERCRQDIGTFLNN